MHGAVGGDELRSLSVRPATRATITDYYGEMTRESIRGYVAYLDDEAVGIIGLARQGSINVLFSEYQPELEPYLKRMTILRAIKSIMEIAASHPGFVEAISDRDEGDRILTRYGFEDIEESH